MHWIDPDCLSPVTAKVERFLFNPRGQADGLILSDNLEAHFPPHLSPQVLDAIEPGDRVTLYGVRPRATKMVACVAIESASGVRIDDTGPPPKAKKKAHKKHGKKHDTFASDPMETEGTVERVLHGPKGEIRGVLFTEGCIVRFPPHAAKSLSSLLVPGAQIAARGDGITNDQFTVIEAHAMGRTKRTLQPLPAKHP